MLIPSERHREADLALWADLEAADAAHAATNRRVERLVARAAEEIDRFVRADGGAVYASASWGKDSVALAHVAALQNPEIPLVWVRVEPIFNPDCLAVRDAFLARHPSIRYAEIVVRCRSDRYGWHASGTLEEGFRAARARYGGRRISGVRADESGRRTVSARVHGVSSETSCRPILRWSAADVFALHQAAGLPTHPAYAMLGGGRYDRSRVRVSSLGGRRGDGFGRAEWEREYYGDVLRRLESSSRMRQAI